LSLNSNDQAAQSLLEAVQALKVLVVAIENVDFSPLDGVYDQIPWDRVEAALARTPETNTALVEAAPDCLLALENLMDWFGERDDWADWEGVDEVIDQANAAIAKATSDIQKPSVDA